LSIDTPSSLDKNYDMTILKRNPNTGEKLVMVKDRRRGSLGSPPRFRVAINAARFPHQRRDPGGFGRGGTPSGPPGPGQVQYNRFNYQRPHQRFIRPDVRHRDLRRLLPAQDRRRNQYVSPDVVHALHRLRTFYPKDAYVDYFDHGFSSKYRYQVA
jgi:hypothetical protein